MWDLIVSVPDHCLSFYFSLRGKSIFSRCGHSLLNPFQPITFMFPVTLLAVYAVTFILTLPGTLFNSISTGIYSKVLTCLFKTLTVTVSSLPLRHSSAATSSLTYVFMLASSSKALTFSERLLILVGLGRSFCVCCLAHRGSTVGFLLLQCSSGVVRHPSDLQVSVATRSCRVLIFASS